MTDWKTIPIKVKTEEAVVLDRLAKFYKISRNKLIKNILGLYLHGELQNSVFVQLQLEEMVPKEMIKESERIQKQYEEFIIRVQNHFSEPDIQKILKKKWRQTPKEVRDNLKRAGSTVHSFTRQRRRKIGRPKKIKDKKRGRPKK